MSRALLPPPRRVCPLNSWVTSLNPPSALPLKQFLLCYPLLLFLLLLPACIASALALLLRRGQFCQCLCLAFCPPAGCCITPHCTASVSCCATISCPLDAWHSPPPLIGAAASCLLRYEKLWYLFLRYLHVSPGTTWKCMLHDSVRYQNTRSRDPIMLLSMDILVETFLFGDRCVRPISTDTTFARPIVYGSIKNILILKYWASRKAKFHDISWYLADHVSCRVTHIAHYTFVFTR